MINPKSILITGGTGSFGVSYLNYCLKNYKNIKKIIIFSRDEFKHHILKQSFPDDKFPNIRFFIGDIRDKDRLQYAFRDIDLVVHAAALKQVDTAEYNPTEFIKTNILGSQNVIDAAINQKIKKVIAISTDKASSPSSLYGATKLCADRLFLSSSIFVPKGQITKFSVLRYGNVFGSRGSIIPKLFNFVGKGKIFPISDPNVTRFSFTLDQVMRTVDWVLKNSLGDDLIIPKMKSYRLSDIIKIFEKKLKFNVVGLAPAEKLHEELISSTDLKNTFSIKDYYINTKKFEKIYKGYSKKFKVNKNHRFTSYNSFENNYLTHKELSEQIINHETRLLKTIY